MEEEREVEEEGELEKGEGKDDGGGGGRRTSVGINAQWFPRYSVW